MITHLTSLIELNFLMLKWCSKMSYSEQLIYLPKIQASIEYVTKCIEVAKKIISG